MPYLIKHQNRDSIRTGETLFRENRPHEALRIFESISRKDSHNVEALNNRGVVLNALGKFEEAAKIFSDVLALGPDADAAANLVSNYLAASDWESAEASFVKYAHVFSARDSDILAADIVEQKSSRKDCKSVVHLPLVFKYHDKACRLKFVLDIEKYSQKTILRHLSKGDIYEHETLKFLANTLREGDCFVDVGAHVGYFTLFVSRFVNPGGRVIAVEPEVQNVAHLRKHICINGIDNVHVIHAAAGAKRTTAKFFVNVDNDGGHALWNPGLHPFNKKSKHCNVNRETKVETIGSIIRNQGVSAVTVIKIDTEGAELEVLKGGIEYLSQNQVPYLICEINRFGLNQMGGSEKEMRGLMYELGYESFFLDSKKGTPIKINRDQYIQTPYVFNLLFSKV